MRALWSMVVVLASGCVTVQTRTTETLSSEGVAFVQGRTDSGDLAYDGIGIREEFAVGIRSWGFGSGKRKAGARRDDNDFTVAVEADILALQAFAGDRSGVDFSVVGPGIMHLDLATLNGDVVLANVEGSHIVTGDGITARNVVGDADLYSNSGGVDAEILPYEDGIVSVTSVNGGVDLYVPWGLEYDLNVIADPEFELVVEDLGFDTLVLEPGIAIGWRGRRSIQVDVFVTGGDTRILSAF